VILHNIVCHEFLALNHYHSRSFFTVCGRR
jgi:hypothetical protein